VEQLKNIKGRGASSDPGNRFEKLRFQQDLSDLSNLYGEEDKPRLKTEFYVDKSKTILASNDSPDVGFTYSINPYRGCEHGCAYCYARPTHEYLGFSAGLDFESKIIVKHNAPELLRRKLESPTWKPQVIMMSGNTDCYQPIERKLEITRKLLKVLLDFRNPVSMITKNQLVTRDIDLLRELARFNAVNVTLSITSLDDELVGVLEPRTSRPQARLRTIEELAKNGIPVGVNVAPVIVGLNDHEMPKILEAAANAGAITAAYIPVRLPHAVAPLFTEWLEVHRPLRKEKVLHAIEETRGGKLNDPRFGKRMRGEGERADMLKNMFDVYTKKYGLNEKRVELSIKNFTQHPGQLDFFI
jgi:DNA repair photolyase